jgi:hypothetical protein
VSTIGEPDRGTACAMSLVAHLAGEGHTDRPGCVSPLVRDFVIPVNDHMPREARQRLKPFVPRLVGTNDGLDRARAEVLRRVLVEVVLPSCLVAEHRWDPRVRVEAEFGWRLRALQTAAKRRGQRVASTAPVPASRSRAAVKRRSRAAGRRRRRA